MKRHTSDELGADLMTGKWISLMKREINMEDVSSSIGIPFLEDFGQQHKEVPFSTSCQHQNSSRENQAFTFIRRNGYLKHYINLIVKKV